LRHSLRSGVRSRAVLHVLIPSVDEVGMAKELQCATTAAREHYVHSTHLVPSVLFDATSALIPRHENF